MSTSRSSHQRNIAGSESASNTAGGQDRSHVQQILHEVGLNPGDYVFSPPPQDNAPEESDSRYPSAFSSVSRRESPSSTQNLFKSHGTSVITSGRPLSYAQQPPLQPPPPPSTSSQQSRQPLPPPPPPIASQNPSAQAGSSQPVSLFSRLGLGQPNTASQGPPPPEQPMDQRLFSPRRSPPSPPQFSSRLNESNLNADHYLRQINAQETPPVKVVKPNTQNVVYRKEIRIRYLQPPTPPPPAPIIIREKHDPPAPPQSPLLIRERKAEARTPPPLTIRERPPTPPAPVEPYVIEKNIPSLPPQPRQIIIERLPTPPPKPRTVIFEKWLPYKKVKRPVLLQKAPPLEPAKPTRNVIIEYEPLKAFTVRRVIEEGVFRVDPHQYSTYNTQNDVASGDVRIVERIEDLPPPSEQLMRVLDDYNQPGQHSSSHLPSYGQPSQQHHQSHNLSEHIPSSIQHLLADARPVSGGDHLTNISRASAIPAYRQERVLSTGYNSSNPSPTIIPIRPSRSKQSQPSRSQRYTPRDSPANSHVDDIY